MITMGVMLFIMHYGVISILYCILISINTFSTIVVSVIKQYQANHYLEQIKLTWISFPYRHGYYGKGISKSRLFRSLPLTYRYHGAPKTTLRFHDQ